jgi:hypothetical protein
MNPTDWQDELKSVSKKQTHKGVTCWIYDKSKAATKVGFRIVKGRPYFNLSLLNGASERQEVPATRVLALLRQMNPRRLVASHRCHNGLCINPSHIVFEPQGINAHRTRCKRKKCQHKPKCLKDGTLARETSVYLQYSKKNGYKLKKH